MGGALAVAAVDSFRRSKALSLALGGSALMMVVGPLHSYGVLSEKVYDVASDAVLYIGPPIVVGTLVLGWIERRKRGLER